MRFDPPLGQQNTVSSSLTALPPCLKAGTLPRLAVRKDRRPKGWQTTPQYLVERALSSRPPRPRAGECLALADVQWPERVCAAQRGPKAD